MKVYGPYTRKDGRKHVIYVSESGKRKTESYPRFLLKQAGIPLSETDTVDHIDNDKTNDALDNLQVLSSAENAKKAMQLRPRKWFQFVCPVCNSEATKPLNFVLNNRRQGKKGPFCSRRCAGKYKP